jgi:hypothetical protein
MILFIIIKFTVDVLPPTKLRMEACPNFQQGGNATLYLDFPGGGFGYYQLVSSRWSLVVSFFRLITDN